MRLWHKDLIEVLPHKQLVGQWRECCLIAKNISADGTPNHLLVNRIMEYPMSHLYNYGVLVCEEMGRRGYKCDFNKFSHWFTYPHETYQVDFDDLFVNWHTHRYFWQCFYNLEEKHDCGGMSDTEWDKILIKTLNY